MADKVHDIVSVGIYISGDQLDPEYVSDKLNAKPTRREKKGDKRVFGNRDIISKNGLWAKEIMLRGEDVEKHLEHLRLYLKSMDAVDILALDNVSDAHADVYVGTRIENDAARASFKISWELISELQKLKIPLMLTFGADKVENGT